MANTNQTETSPRVPVRRHRRRYRTWYLHRQLQVPLRRQPDQQRNNFRGSNGDSSDFDQQIAIGNLSLDQWYTASATVTIAGSDSWTGTFEISRPSSEQR